MQDSRTYMQQLDSCKAPNNALCPSSDIVLDDQKGKCVKSMVLCFNQTVKSVNLTALNAPCGTMGNEHVRTCLLHTCTAGLPCAPAAMECSANMSYRCADWSCAASEQDCPTYSAGANQVLCPDGVTKKRCSALNVPKDLTRFGLVSDWAGCAQAAITWQGCPPWQSSCSSNPKYCGSKDMSCDRPPSPGPVPQTAMLMPGTANQQIMLNSSDGMTAFALKASSQNAFRRVDNATDAVNFTISSVVSSILQQGPFAQYFKAGKIVSEVITIEPSADLTIEGGLQIDIPLAGRIRRQALASSCLREVMQAQRRAAQPCWVNSNLLLSPTSSTFLQCRSELATAAREQLATARACAQSTISAHTLLLISASLQPLLPRKLRLRPVRHPVHLHHRLQLFQHLSCPLHLIAERLAFLAAARRCSFPSFCCLWPQSASKTVLEGSSDWTRQFMTH
eukprot:761852-Hanusia_phi.AAC.6